MLSLPSGQSPPNTLADYRWVSVDVISECLPLVDEKVGSKQLLRLMKSSVALVLVDANRQVLGVFTLNDLPREAIGTSAHWLKTLYRQTPELFDAHSVSVHATAQAAEALLGQSLYGFLPLVDEKGRYVGRCVSADLLNRLKAGTLRPRRVGGLATPLGVYMTSGYYSAGSGWKGLVVTGLLFGLLARGLEWLALLLFTVLVMFYPPAQLLPAGEQAILEGGLLIVCLMALLRLSPMVGLHAAEHMTINAMEQGLPLTESVVRTQSRIHKRCGTNLVVLLLGAQVVGLSVYFGLERMSGLGLLLYSTFWLWLVLSFWKVAGFWMQQHFTTKDPTPAQLNSGIKAGQELLAKFNAKPHGAPGFFMRLWGAGLFQMLAAFALSFWLVGLLLAPYGLS